MNAHNTAVSGDVINLSGGTFTVSEITKAVTIRGAGINETNISNNNSSTYIDISTTDTCQLVIECIRFTDRVYFKGTSSNTLFNKCNFTNSSDGIYFDSNSYHENLKFVNCNIMRFSGWGTNSVKLIHCRINSSFQGSSSIQLLNCVVAGSFVNFPPSATFVNCILRDNYGGSATLPSNNIAMNCVAIASSSDPYANMQSNKVDCVKSTIENVFSNTDTYELTDYAKSNYLGTDGTEVGLYGGIYPYNTTPTYPRITNLTVDKQTTADDKLNVEIEVSSAE